MPKYTRANSCQWHCSLCDACFSSLAAFDAHLRPPRPGKVRHRKPWKVVALRIRTKDGKCDNQAPTDWHVVIWEHAEQTDNARARFAELEKKTKGKNRAK